MFLRRRDLEILGLKELFKMLQDTTGLFEMFLMYYAWSDGVCFESLDSRDLEF
jgi:hypothetical protein